MSCIHPLFAKAAMLFRGITQGHPFHDGNKRTGFLLTSYSLELSGYPPPAVLDEDAVVALCMRVSSGELHDVAAITGELRQLWEVKPEG